MEKIRETKYNEWFRNIFLESFGLGISQNHIKWEVLQ